MHGKACSATSAVAAPALHLRDEEYNVSTNSQKLILETALEKLPSDISR